MHEAIGIPDAEMRLTVNSVTDAYRHSGDVLQQMAP